MSVVQRLRDGGFDNLLLLLLLAKFLCPSVIHRSIMISLLLLLVGRNAHQKFMSSVSDTRFVMLKFRLFRPMTSLNVAASNRDQTHIRIYRQTSNYELKLAKYQGNLSY